MPKDYAAKSRSASKTSTPKSRRPSNPKATPAKSRFWLGFLSGFASFAIGLGAFNAIKKPSHHKLTARTAQDSTPTIPKPRFDFYNILQESSVKVDTNNHVEHQPSPHASETAQTYQDVKANQTQRVKPHRTTPTEIKSHWSLQAGSFRDRKDADRLRARLLLLNFSVTVDTVTPSSDKGTWHRVLVGPYTSQQSLSNAKSHLAKLRIQSFSIRS